LLNPPYRCCGYLAKLDLTAAKALPLKIILCLICFGPKVELKLLENFSE